MMIEAVLHYSQRSARAFLEAARADGVEITALAVPQCCISAQCGRDLARGRRIAGVFGGEQRTKRPFCGFGACFAVAIGVREPAESGKF